MVKYRPPFKEDDVVYEITVADIIEVAEGMGIPPEKVTDTVVSYIQGKLDSALDSWSTVVEDGLSQTIVNANPN